MRWPDQSRIVKLVKEMVSIDSRIGKESELAYFLHDKLNALGLDMELEEKGEIINLYGLHTYSPDGKTIMLNGHLDTVEPSPEMDDPFLAKVSGEWLYGLGAADMKGGIACIIETVEHLVEQELKGALTVSFVSDEEGYGKGAKNLIRHPKWRAIDGIMIAEPFFDKGIILGMTGKVLYKISVHGKSAHAFRPLEGINAITDAAKLIVAIEEDNKETFPFDPNFGTPSFCTLKVEGGYTKYNVKVPETCTIIINRLISPTETQKSVIADLWNLIYTLNLESEVEIEIVPPFYKSYQIKQNQPLVKSLVANFRKTTRISPHFTYENMITDANIFTGEAGIPSLVFGPRGEGLHAKDERLFLPSLVPTTQIIGGTVMDFLNFDT